MTRINIAPVDQWSTGPAPGWTPTGEYHASNNLPDATTGLLSLAFVRAPALADMIGHPQFIAQVLTCPQLCGALRGALCADCRAAARKLFPIKYKCVGCVNPAHTAEPGANGSRSTRRRCDACAQVRSSADIECTSCHQRVRLLRHQSTHPARYKVISDVCYLCLPLTPDGHHCAPCANRVWACRTLVDPTQSNGAVCESCMHRLTGRDNTLNICRCDCGCGERTYVDADTGIVAPLCQRCHQKRSHRAQPLRPRGAASR